MGSEVIKSLRLKKIKIENFKAIDSLELEFPEPLMADDPDVFGFGSKNGLGKTSLLEACSLLMLSTVTNERDWIRIIEDELPYDFFNLCVRSDAKYSSISGKFTINGIEEVVSIEVGRNGDLNLPSKRKKYYSVSESLTSPNNLKHSALLSLNGFLPEPLLLPPFLFLHSYRKISERKLEIGMGVEPDTRMMNRRDVKTISLFKRLMVNLLMHDADFADFDVNDDNVGNELKILNSMIEKYTGGQLGKPKVFIDNTIEIMIKPANGRKPFPFDGLSSGQKEIISTLFLIWKYTKDTPGIVLIDEPELHLNAEWHSDIIDQLYKIAPKNQYIVATHSESVFSSIPKDRRFIMSEKVEV